MKTAYILSLISNSEVMNFQKLVNYETKNSKHYLEYDIKTKCTKANTRRTENRKKEIK